MLQGEGVVEDGHIDIGSTSLQSWRSDCRSSESQNRESSRVDHVAGGDVWWELRLVVVLMRVYEAKGILKPPCLSTVYTYCIVTPDRRRSARNCMNRNMFQEVRHAGTDTVVKEDCITNLPSA